MLACQAALEVASASLRTLKMLFYCLLASAAAAEKSCIHHMGSFVDNLFCPLVTFNTFSLSLMFHCDMTRCGFNYIYFAQDFFLLFYPEVSSMSSNCLLLLPVYLEYFLSSMFTVHLGKTTISFGERVLAFMLLNKSALTPGPFFFLGRSLLLPVISTPFIF